jgi:hypothetical protein
LLHIQLQTLSVPLGRVPLCPKEDERSWKIDCPFC